MIKGVGEKRGLSAVVTSVIIILLVIVAIILIWAFIYAFLQRGGEQIEELTSCLELQLSVERALKESSASQYAITVRRGGGGSGNLTAIIFYFSDGARSDSVQETIALEEFQTITLVIPFSKLSVIQGGASSVEAGGVVKGDLCTPSGRRDIEELSPVIQGAQPDLALTSITQNPSGNIRGGNSFTYTFTISNNGEQSATNVRLTTIQALDSTVSRMISSNPPNLCSYSSNYFLTCSFASLASRATNTVSVTFATSNPSSDKTLNSRFRVSSSVIDNNPEDNERNITTIVTHRSGGGDGGGPQPVCGDNQCEAGEDTNNCPSDCGTCDNNGICDSDAGETNSCQDCAVNCPAGQICTITFSGTGNKDGNVIESLGFPARDCKDNRLNLTIGHQGSAGTNTGYNYRSFVNFNTSALPDNAIIKSVSLKLSRIGTSTTSLGNGRVEVRRLGTTGANCATPADVSALYGNIASGTLYRTLSLLEASGSGYRTTSPLGTQANQDLQTQLSANYFNIGLKMTPSNESLANNLIYLDSSESGNGLILIVNYSIPFVSAVCGNGICELGETNSTCPADCGRQTCNSASDCPTIPQHICSAQGYCCQILSLPPPPQGCYYNLTTDTQGCTVSGTPSLICEQCSNHADCSANEICLENRCVRGHVLLPSSDGETYTPLSGPQSCNDNSNNFRAFGFLLIGNAARSFLNFDTSSIPDSATISNVQLKIYVNASGNLSVPSGLLNTVSIKRLTGNYVNCSTNVGMNLSNAIRNAPAYVNVSYSSPGYYTVSLPPSAVADFQSRLSLNTFHLGLMLKNETDPNIFAGRIVEWRSREYAGSEPQLIVTYS